MDLTIRNLRKQLGDTQYSFAEHYHVPFRTIQNWESGVRKPPEYIIDLLQHRVKEDLYYDNDIYSISFKPCYPQILMIRRMAL